MTNTFDSVRTNINLINQWLIQENLVKDSSLDISIKGTHASIEPKKKDISEQDKKQYEQYFHENLSIYEKRHIERILERDFSFLMIDNSIVQCLYRFDNFNLISQKMAFYQSPFMMPYDSHFEYYDEGKEEMLDGALGELGEVVSFRFDYEPTNFREIDHPNTHLHLGVYKNCRMAVSTPLSVMLYFEMLIKNFYSNTYESFFLYMEKNKGFVKPEKYQDCITDREKKHVYIAIPA